MTRLNQDRSEKMENHGSSLKGNNGSPLQSQDKGPVKVGFLLLSDFSMIAFSNAIEVFRMANHLSHLPLYTWNVVPVRESGIQASNGLVVQGTGTIADLAQCDLVLVCAGINARYATDEHVRSTLHHLAACRVPLGGMCTGSYALASAGLLDGYRCAVHWEYLAAMREEFPRVQFVQAVFNVDRDRYTSSGGTAPLDLALHLVRTHHGARLAMKISEQFIVERQRASTDRQRMPQPERIGPGYEHLIEATEIMAANIEEPLAVQELADAIHISLRQLERLFHRYHDMNPAQYYMNLRLRRAHELLTQTSMPIMQITIACGFQSASHFCRAYRNLFSHPPSEERRRQVTRPTASRKVVQREPEMAAVDQLRSTRPGELNRGEAVMCVYEASMDQPEVVAGA